MADLISGSDILAEQQVDVKMERLTPLQQAGMRLAIGVGAVTFLVMVGLWTHWMWHTPTVPSLVIDSTNGQAVITDTKLLMDNYKIAAELAMDGPSRMFDQMVVKMLYPLFTLILGYVFGANNASTSTQE